MLQVVLVVLAHHNSTSLLAWWLEPWKGAGSLVGQVDSQFLFKWLDETLNFGRCPILLRRHSHQACAFMAKSSGFPQLLFEKIPARITALWPRVFPGDQVETGGAIIIADSRNNRIIRFGGELGVAENHILILIILILVIVA